MSYEQMFVKNFVVNFVFIRHDKLESKADFTFYDNFFLLFIQIRNQSYILID